MIKISISVEIEYYTVERLQRVVALLEKSGFEREPNRKDYDIIPMGDDTTVVINGVVATNNKNGLETVKDVVKLHSNADFVLFGARKL